MTRDVCHFAHKRPPRSLNNLRLPSKHIFRCTSCEKDVRQGETQSSRHVFRKETHNRPASLHPVGGSRRHRQWQWGCKMGWVYWDKKNDVLVLATTTKWCDIAKADVDFVFTLAERTANQFRFYELLIELKNWMFLI